MAITLLHVSEMAGGLSIRGRAGKDVGILWHRGFAASRIVYVALRFWLL